MYFTGDGNLSEQYIEFLKSRRSIRVFKDEELDLDTILKILDIARWAPSARNAQPWEFIIVRNKETLKKLGELSPATRPILNAPAAIVVVTDPGVAPVTYQVDGACVTMYILLAIHALGLGGVWINALRYQDEIRKLLKMPESKVPIAIVALGKPAEKPKPKPRKDVKEMTYLEYYGNKI